MTPDEYGEITQAFSQSLTAVETTRLTANAGEDTDAQIRESVFIAAARFGKNLTHEDYATLSMEEIFTLLKSATNKRPKHTKTVRDLLGVINPKA